MGDDELVLAQKLIRNAHTFVQQSAWVLAKIED